MAMMIWRKHQYYDKNIFWLNSMMSAMSFTAFAFPIVKFEQRSQLCFAVMFGIVALRFVADEHCPMLEFQTCAQKHLNGRSYAQRATPGTVAS